MGAIRAVLFDIYQTLIEIKTDEEAGEVYEFLARWLSYHGVEIDGPALRLKYLELCSEEMSKTSETYPEINIGSVFARILLESRDRSHFDVGTKAREIALLFRMLTTNSISTFPGVTDMLNSLKGKTTIGIVSNAQHLFTIPELSKFNLIPFFDAITLSSDVGVRKPDPKIFHTLLDAIAVPPEAAVFIGDNPFDDVYGAGNVGMKTIWIRRDGKNYDLPGSARPDHVIEGGSYDALTHLLLSMLD